MFEAHITIFRTYSATERIVEYEGHRVPTSLIEVIAGVVRVDDIIATVVTTMANGRILKGNGVIRGKATVDYLPEYAQEVSILHALRTYKDWMRKMEQRLIQKVNIRAGTGLICYQLEKWMEGGMINFHICLILPADICFHNWATSNDCIVLTKSCHV